MLCVHDYDWVGSPLDNEVIPFNEAGKIVSPDIFVESLCRGPLAKILFPGHGISMLQIVPDVLGAFIHYLLLLG